LRVRRGHEAAREGGLELVDVLTREGAAEGNGVGQTRGARDWGGYRHVAVQGRDGIKVKQHLRGRGRRTLRHGVHRGGSTATGDIACQLTDVLSRQSMIECDGERWPTVNAADRHVAIQSGDRVTVV